VAIDRKFEERSIDGLVQLLLFEKRSSLDDKKKSDKWHIVERNDATRHQSDEVGGTYCATEGERLQTNALR